MKDERTFKEENEMTDMIEGAKKYQQYLEKKDIKNFKKEELKMNIIV